MAILAIAEREGARAYAEAEGGPEAKVKAYRTVHEETLKRGRKAEQIIAAGAVRRNGEPSSYSVKSQNGNGTYTVNLDARACDCPDRQQRGAYCKHLQAVEQWEAASQAAIRRREELAAVMAPYRDPMAPDYGALGSEPVRSQYQDSRDAAGLPGHGLHHGFTEQDWERADYYHDKERER